MHWFFPLGLNITKTLFVPIVLNVFFITLFLNAELDKGTLFLFWTCIFTSLEKQAKKNPGGVNSSKKLI